MCVLKSLDFYKGKNVLLLQGPRGPFFWRLAKDLEKAGANVYKINFNGGDLFFYPKKAINFRGTMKEWKKFLTSFLEEYKIDIVLFFSELRFMHRVAMEVCKEKGILFGIFEEGYIRPNYITLDICGVNGSSLIAQFAERSFRVEDLPMIDFIDKRKIDHPISVGNAFIHEILYAIVYYIAANLFKPLFPHYKHHRSLYFPNSILKEAVPWFLVLFKKPWQNLTEKPIRNKIYRELKGKYYLVPLQVYNDSQILFYSPFRDVKEFIKFVIESFANYAPTNTYLVFKHHPKDRAYRNYKRYIKELASEFKVRERVFYIHDAHLPTLIDNSIGVVVINSSVGFQALDHNKPTIVLGKAVYKFKDVVWPGTLNEFWRGAFGFKVDRKKIDKLKKFILFYSQLNGSLHKKVYKWSNTGLKWEAIDISTCFKIISKLRRILGYDKSK